MSYSRILSRASFGIEAPRVAVEVHLSNGLPAFQIVGLANAEVKESRERVRSALLNSGFELPARRITINLAPADLPKTGGRFDLAIAIGILLASEQLDCPILEEQEFLAELGLNGELKPVSGVLVASHQANTQGHVIWVAEQNTKEASLSGHPQILSAVNLKQVVEFSLAKQFNYYKPSDYVQPIIHSKCLSDVRGNDHAKRALCYSALGGHNMLMVGTPGSGKTMLASCLVSLSPDLTQDEAFAVAALESVSHTGIEVDNWYKRRIRRPHHSCTQVAMTGGGKMPTPGEISLAHYGILFLDELPEFSKSVLESLRQPLEDNELTISRSNWKITFPASFQLIAAMNPCPCGYLTSNKTACRCSEIRLKSYLEKVSGPLLDRIDIQVMVNETEHTILDEKKADGYTSSEIRARIEVLREQQIQRQGCFNAQLSAEQIKTIKDLDNKAKQVFYQAIEQYNLSMRAQQKLLRLALTISDWNTSDSLDRASMLEALSYRAFDQVHEKLAKGFMR